VSKVEVRDRQIWIRHIVGNSGLVRMLEALSAGELVTLFVNGFRGDWVKMENRPDNSPTPGLRPVGPARAEWLSLFQAKRGSLVTIDHAYPEGGSARTEASMRESGFHNYTTHSEAFHAGRGRLEVADVAEREVGRALLSKFMSSGLTIASGADRIGSWSRDELNERGGAD
jgi:hypothetical protein